MLEEAGISAKFKFRVEWAENLVKDKGGKEWAEGTSLGKAFILEEERPLTVVIYIPAVVSRLVKEIEEGKEVGEVGAEGIANGGAGASIKHVDNV
jgi:hypothetical protein